jgi:hypothetical protein
MTKYLAAVTLGADENPWPMSLPSEQKQPALNLHIMHAPM